jgi:hypothetical protein
MPPHAYDYFANRGKWYLRTHDNVMGPFGDRHEAEMAVHYFQQCHKWPSTRQLHDFIGAREARSVSP